MNFRPLKCTCVLRCTSNGTPTMLCRGGFGANYKTNSPTPTMFTIVHKYTRPNLSQKSEQLFEKISNEVVKKSLKLTFLSVLMYFSVINGFSRQFLPCTLLAILNYFLVECTLKKGYVHQSTPRKGILDERSWILLANG